MVARIVAVAGQLAAELDFDGNGGDEQIWASGEAPGKFNANALKRTGLDLLTFLAS